ncbi:hypothetical protein NKG05_05515 [Oerskovia sp. M15]
MLALAIVEEGSRCAIAEAHLRFVDFLDVLGDPCHGWVRRLLSVVLGHFGDPESRGVRAGGTSISSIAAPPPGPLAQHPRPSTGTVCRSPPAGRETGSSRLIHVREIFSNNPPDGAGAPADAAHGPPSGHLWGDLRVPDPYGDPRTRPAEMVKPSSHASPGSRTVGLTDHDRSTPTVLVRRRRPGPLARGASREIPSPLRRRHPPSGPTARGADRCDRRPRRLALAGTSAQAAPQPANQPATVAAAAAPGHQWLTGYWHNFNNGSVVMPLSDIPAAYNLVAVAFADNLTGTPAASRSTSRPPS